MQQQLRVERGNFLVSKKIPLNPERCPGWSFSIFSWRIPRGFFTRYRSPRG